MNITPQNNFFSKLILQHLIDNPTLFTNNPQYYDNRENEPKTINDYFLEILNLPDKHVLNNDYTGNTLQELIIYCKNLTLDDFKTENSFRKKITLEKYSRR